MTVRLVLGAGLILAACQHGGARPAVLAGGDEAGLARLTAAIETELARGPVVFGPPDPTQSARISVLPPPLHPLEDRSLALPDMFRLEREAGACFLVREATGRRIRLDGVACLPADS